MSEGDNADVGRAPICPSCGVTALPAETSNVIASGYVCENPDCDAFGDAVESGVPGTNTQWRGHR